MLMQEERQAVEGFAGKSVQEVIADVAYLRDLHEPRREQKRRMRDILNGGPEGISALLGDTFRGSNPPVNNLMHSGLSRLAQKIGRPPDLKVPPHRDRDTARKNAERRERIVHGYDDGCRLDLQLPQVGRWLPGYGYAVWTIHDGFDVDGNPFPMGTLRDPYSAYPSSWGVTQQPDRIAFIRQFDVRRLKRMYPQAADQLTLDRGYGGAVILGNDRERGSWEGNNTYMVEVAEYVDNAGTWTVIADRDIVLDFTPNPIRPMAPFVLAKRFSFDRLIGHYDHAIGLMAANARLNLLTLIAMEDAVFSETVVSGELARGDKWLKGRDAVNYLQPGSSAQRMGSGVNPQMFQEIDRIERQLRTTVNYSIMDDSQSPNSFVTGRGLDNLKAGVDNDVAEYQTVLTRAVEELDTKRLAWDEAAYGDLERPLFGEGAPDTYRAKRDIDGRHRTRRRYGVMAGWDDPSKVVTGLQLLQAEVIDRLTFQENIRGLEDVTEVNRRIDQQRSEQALRDAMLAAAQQGDPRAVMALIEMMPAGDSKSTLQKFYTPDGQQMSPEEQQLAEPAAPEGPESTTTILSRLMGSGEAQGGAQTVGTL